ncbi:MAG: diguanylate cyclase [Deltaproteobacteria bacterium]|nr:diguanylate cyclase [Deltaproteobacteria bacterium]
MDSSDSSQILILLVEDDVGDALLVQEMLSEIKAPRFIVTHVDRVAKAMAQLREARFGVILLDLSLPDGQGMDLVKAVRLAAPETPIVVMSGQRDDDLALKIVQEGVQDYCVKGHVDSFLLTRTLQYAIERKRIEDALRRSNTELAVLFHVSSTVSRCIDMQGLLADIIGSLAGMEILSLKWQGAILTVEDDGSLRLAQELGHSPAFIEAHQRLHGGECLCGVAVESGEMVVSSDAFQDARHTLRYAGMEPHGHIIIPLKSRERVVGILCLDTVPGISVREGERKLLLSIGEQVGIAVANARLYEETRRLALHDSLTGLANRRHLDIMAESNLARARRHGTPFAIILLDLDHFKRYNDTHGHSAGDQLLVAVANTMKHEVRETSLVVRYGGEEFLVLLSDTEITAALAVAERIRLKIQENTGVTVSLGVSWAKDADRSLAALIAEADAALYQAKNSGRNRVARAETRQNGEDVHG